MDALALLCTLYGEGPRTRSRLREAGWDSVELLVELDPATLAGALGASVDGALRFQREARALAARLGLTLDHEEGSELPRELQPTRREPSHAASTDPQEPPQPFGTQGSPSSPSSPSSPPSPPSPGEPRVAVRDGVGLPVQVRDVLDRWRELDVEGEVRNEWIPRPALPTAAPLSHAGRRGMVLGAGAFDGCTPQIVETLARAGVTTLEELGRTEPLELARRVDRPLTDCQRWTFMARRALREARLSPANDPESWLRLGISGDGADEAEGPGGPFA